MRLIFAAPLLVLAACGSNATRISVPELPVPAQVAVGVGSVELIEVELPAYADGDTIFVQTGVALRRAGGAVWADDPSRAVTLELARALHAIAGIPVAPEPWPYDGDPDVQLDLRLAEFGPDRLRMAFVVRGLYFVAAQGDRAGPNRAREVAVSAPLADLNPATIAVARAQAVNQLAAVIAAEGLR